MKPEVLALIHQASFTTPRPWDRGEFTALLADPKVFAIGDETAFCLGRVVLDEAELLTLATDPAARRQGRGRALLAAFEHTARAKGAARAFLEVSAENSAAKALYLAAGWQHQGTRKGYYRAPDGTRLDALIFAKPLI